MIRRRSVKTTTRSFWKEVEIMEKQGTRFDAVLCRMLDLSMKEDLAKHTAFSFLAERDKAILLDECREVLKTRKRHLLMENEKKAAAIYLYLSGYSLKYIASIICVDEKMFQNIVDSVRKNFQQFLHDIKITSLSDSDKRNILQTFQHPPRLVKVNADKWSLNNASYFLRDRYGVNLPQKEVQDLLYLASLKIPQEQKAAPPQQKLVQKVEVTVQRKPQAPTIFGKDVVADFVEEKTEKRILPVRIDEKPSASVSTETAENTNIIKKEEEFMKPIPKETGNSVRKKISAYRPKTDVEKAALLAAENVTYMKGDALERGSKDFFQLSGYSLPFAKKMADRLFAEKVESVLESYALDKAVATDWNLKLEAESILKQKKYSEKVLDEARMIRDALIGEKTFSELAEYCGYSTPVPLLRLKSVRKFGVLETLKHVFPEDFEGEVPMRKQMKVAASKPPKAKNSVKKETEDKGIMAKEKKVSDKVLGITIDTARKKERNLPFSDKQKEEICKKIAAVLPKMKAKDEKGILRLKTFYLTLKGYPASYAQELFSIHGGSTARAYASYFISFYEKASGDAAKKLKGLLDHIESFGNGEVKPRSEKPAKKADKKVEKKAPAGKTDKKAEKKAAPKKVDKKHGKKPAKKQIAEVLKDEKTKVGTVSSVVSREFKYPVSVDAQVRQVRTALANLFEDLVKVLRKG